MTEFTKPEVGDLGEMTRCCDVSTWLDYMDNIVMDIRLETWSMAVLCRSTCRGVTYGDPMRNAKAGMLCR